MRERIEGRRTNERFLSKEDGGKQICVVLHEKGGKELELWLAWEANRFQDLEVKNLGRGGTPPRFCTNSFLFRGEDQPP